MTTTAERGGLSNKLNPNVCSIILKVTEGIHDHNMITWYQERIISKLGGVGGGSTIIAFDIFYRYMLDVLLTLELLYIWPT